MPAMSETIVASARSTASPDTVWQVLGDDFFAIADWASTVTHSSAMTPLPAGPGASRRVVAGATVLLENVTEWQPGALLAYELAGLPPIVRRVENRWEIGADGEGSTVALRCTVEPGPRPPMRLAAKVLAKRIAKTNRSLLTDLVARTQQEAAS